MNFAPKLEEIERGPELGADSQASHYFWGLQTMFDEPNPPLPFTCFFVNKVLLEHCYVH